MKHQADILLPQRATRLRPRGTGLFNAFTGNLDQENTVLVCSAARTTKFTSHTSDVSWVTDIDYLALIMFRYSASSSEARQALLPEKLELIRAGDASIHERPPRVIRSQMAAKSASSKRPYRGQGTSTFRPYFVHLSQGRFMELNYPKTATSTVRIQLLPAANLFNQ